MLLGDFSAKGVGPDGLPPGLLAFLGLPRLAPIIKIVLKKSTKKQFLINYKIRVPAVQVPLVCYIMLLASASEIIEKAMQGDIVGCGGGGGGGGGGGENELKL